MFVCEFVELELGAVVIVGLGNPGSEYEGTRHNLGARCVLELGRRLGVEVSRRRWRSLVGSSVLPDGRTVWLVLPQTMMNLSGRAAFEAVRDTGASVSDVWAVYDEIDLPLCRLRIRVGGSSAGHNGVRSLTSSLGSDGFVRFRVGVGRPATRARSSGVSYVLGRFSRAEAERLPSVVEGVASALSAALADGVTRAMDLYNRSGSLGCEELA